ncbi:TetR/AcrR family transcriptional regulator [Pectobacterium cacticida]|uniref:TetR/AcrR family transcriptional regulator n=1 Tax=Pectobacterium cacticida TaxID=69221 RepID=UPI003985D291
MIIFQSSDEDERILPTLARAMVEQPRATLQELAKAVGISKAKLYRYCRTRQELIERLIGYGHHTLTDALHRARLSEDPPLDALRRLIIFNLDHKDLTSFLMHYWRDVSGIPNEQTSTWEAILDEFFLRGQYEGVFRIDIPAPALTEVFVGTLMNLIDAERRGRVARLGLAVLIEQTFLNGAHAVCADDITRNKSA